MTATRNNLWIMAPAFVLLFMMPQLWYVNGHVLVLRAILEVLR